MTLLSLLDTMSGLDVGDAGTGLGEAPAAPGVSAEILGPATEVTAAKVLNSYLVVFIVAFLATLVITPLVRRLALRAGIVDWPDKERKNHAEPVPYLGGVAVFVGLVAGIIVSYVVPGYDPGAAMIPPNIVIAMTVVMFTGVADDVFRWDASLKIGGQFVAAAVLAMDEQIGGHVAAGLLRPLEGPMASLLSVQEFSFAAMDIIPGPGEYHANIVYCLGAVILAVFVLGGCNAANLVDGLDGLLTGSTAIMAAALLAICVLLAVTGHGELTSARVVLCFALLGASLGFLPHNFRPATIFLGDAGSLLLGFTIIVIVLLLGEQGQTHLVFAGLIVFGLPIVDTTLAILRRRLNRLPISTPDNDHLHHMLMRTKLGPMGSVFVMYGITLAFAAIAVALVFMRARVVYALFIVLAGFIVVTGIKVARRGQRVAEIAKVKERANGKRGRRGEGRGVSAAAASGDDEEEQGKAAATVGTEAGAGAGGVGARSSRDRV